ncbi:hypothetical protein [Streptosporangium sp. NPDC006007]
MLPTHAEVVHRDAPRTVDYPMVAVHWPRRRWIVLSGVIRTVAP